MTKETKYEKKGKRNILGGGHFRSSLLSLRKMAIFRRERSDDRKCVCCSEARFDTDNGYFYQFYVARVTGNAIINLAGYIKPYGGSIYKGYEPSDRTKITVLY